MSSIPPSSSAISSSISPSPSSSNINNSSNANNPSNITNNSNLSDRPLDPDDHTYIQTQIGESHQDIYFKQWVLVKFHSEDAKKRILVISNFRVLTIKVNLLGRWVRQNFSIINLQKITQKGSETLILTFNDNANPLHLESPRITHIIQHLLFAYQAISYGRQANDSVQLEIPQSALDGFVPPCPDIHDGLLASYLANCDSQEIPQRVSVLDYLMTTFQLEDKSFDIGDCLSFLEKDNTKDILAIANSLKYSMWYNEIVGTDYNLKDTGLTALSSIFERTTAVTTLVLLNIKASTKGFSSLASALSLGNHSLTFLNISKNPIGDSGIIKISESLEQSKKVLHTLCLRDVGMSSKALVQLVNTLTMREWLLQLHILDISDNKIGKTGTAALSTWLNNENCRIEQLFVVRCDIDSDVLIKAIANNENLYKNYLKVLNVGGNKFTKKALPMLAELLSKCVSLAHLFLSNVELPKSSFVALIDSCITNENNVKFTLDFSRNDLGPKGAKELSQCYDKWMKENPAKLTKYSPIHTLIMAENDFGVEGLVTICRALKGTSINTLVLDNNLKLGLFTTGKEAGEAIASLVSNTPELKELSIAGDDNRYYMKAALFPLFSALKEDNCNLTRLNVSNNRLGDEGIIPFATSLQSNTSLLSLIMDNNKLSFIGLTELHKSVNVNKSLIDWQIPMLDIGKIFKGCNEKKMRQLRTMVHEFEIYMERNEEIMLKQKAVMEIFAEREREKNERNKERENEKEKGPSVPSVITYTSSPKDQKSNDFPSPSPSSPLDSVPVSFSSTFVPGFRHRPSIYSTINDDPGFLSSALTRSSLAHHRNLHRKAASRAFDVMFHKAKTGVEGLIVADGNENIVEEEEEGGAGGGGVEESKEEEKERERERDRDRREDEDEGDEEDRPAVVRATSLKIPEPIANLMSDDSAPNSPAAKSLKVQTQSPKGPAGSPSPSKGNLIPQMDNLSLAGDDKKDKERREAEEREKEKEKERDREREREREKEREREREKEREREREKEREKEKEKQREKENEKEKERQKEKERSSVSSAENPSPSPSPSASPSVPTINRTSSIRKDTDHSLPFSAPSSFSVVNVTNTSTSTSSPSTPPTPSTVTSRPTLMAGGKSSIVTKAETSASNGPIVDLSSPPSASPSSSPSLSPPASSSPVNRTSTFRAPSSSTASSMASKDAAASAVAAVNAEGITTREKSGSIVTSSSAPPSAAIVLPPSPKSANSNGISSPSSPSSSPASSFPPSALRTSINSTVAPPPGRPSTSTANSLQIVSEAAASSSSTSSAPLSSSSPSSSVKLDWKTNVFSWDQLTSSNGNSPPVGVDLSCRELYLSDEKFLELFGMNKETFGGIPKWKQQAMKSKHQLFA